MLNLEATSEPRQHPPFRSIAVRSTVAVLSLSADALVSLFLILALAWRVHLLNRIRGHLTVSHADLVYSDTLVLLGSRTLLGVFALAAIAFVLWFYRAHQNLSAFRLEPFGFSHSQAAWSFFIPFVNLVRPYTVMREIWQASDPTLPRFAPEPYSSAPVSPLVSTWWVLFIGRGILGWLAFLPAASGKTIDTLRAHAYFMQAELGVSMIAAAAACSLILLVLSRQNQLGKGMEAVAAYPAAAGETASDPVPLIPK